MKSLLIRSFSGPYFPAFWRSISPYSVRMRENASTLYMFHNRYFCHRNWSKWSTWIFLKRAHKLKSRSFTWTILTYSFLYTLNIPGQTISGKNIFLFYTPWKYQKGFLRFSRGIETEHLIDISSERERIPASKVLKLATLYANFQLTILTNFFEGNASEYWKMMK